MSGWAAIVAEKVPCENDSESARLRRILFRHFDLTEKGVLTPNEVVVGVLKLELPGVTKLTAMRAFTAVARNGGVDLETFQSLLSYLRYYLELWELLSGLQYAETKFDEIKFPEVYSLIKHWNLPAPNFPQLFADMNQVETGYVSFENFSHWAIKSKQRLDRGDTSGVPRPLARPPVRQFTPQEKAASELAKKKLLFDNELYLRKHPELADMIHVFLCSALERRPQNVTQFAIEHFVLNSYFTAPQNAGGSNSAPEKPS